MMGRMSVCCRCAYDMYVQRKLKVALLRLNYISWKQFFIQKTSSAEGESKLTGDRKIELF